MCWMDGLSGVAADPKGLALQMFQTAHPPRRKFQGRVPCVHQGFLATWHAPAMRARVLPLVQELLAAAPHPERVRVLCTGHSLGGAVAQLASFDIVRDLGVTPDRISCYTFGCPRIGNRALAAEFDEVVPDTWHVINDQDIVTRGMKVCSRQNPGLHGCAISGTSAFTILLMSMRSRSDSLYLAAKRACIVLSRCAGRQRFPVSVEVTPNSPPVGRKPAGGVASMHLLPHMWRPADAHA